MTTYILRDLWILACKHDGIDPDSKFVVFSKDNRWIRKYNTLARLRLQSQLRAEAHLGNPFQRKPGGKL